MSDIFIKNIPHEQITTLASQVEVQAGQVVSKTLAQNDALSITIFSFEFIFILYKLIIIFCKFIYILLTLSINSL